ncbi:MAG: UDP-2,4-diacetamido-2,4,6-trideoxy-beta-L-altropyranose hydrolase [Methanobacteriaceae archaeon]|jgi:UDP-2,4-diacetamido-2,4,6-trideoxy-beta-L-altropyranose hydrolase|nr:UDP-2,4-diacetamido-2,4,6-trideoxy-beta-L-altropyranose hydrolase [Methanobacteriaceae archaeon]
MKNLVIRVDADYKTGSGHFMRCLALAESWKEKVGDVFFIMNENEPFKKRIIDEGMNYIPNFNDSGTISDAEFFIEKSQKLNAYWTVVDGYVFKEDFFFKLKKNSLNILMFDDDGLLNHYSADIVLNQNLHGESNWYINKKEDFTKLLIGTKYTLLRKEFLKYLSYKKEISDYGKNILITLGGSDLHNYSLKILKSLNNLNLKDLEIILLIGPNNTHENSLKEYINNSKINVKLIKNTNDMPTLMKWADLVFSGGGSTVWELAFMGVPTIVGASSDVEEVLIKGLNENNLFKTVGKLDSINEIELSNLFHELIINESIREKMNFDGKKYVDGYGYKRVINAMLNE